MTSMASDLSAGRLTEIGTINGEIMRLGKIAGVETPVNTALHDLVRQFERDGRASLAMTRYARKSAEIQS